MSPEELIDRAREAATRAYAPYSGFRVGAALLTDDGRVFEGVNVENASYAVANCAEATAVGNAITAGVRKISAAAIACIDAKSLDLAYPCGRCRQILSEFDPEMVYVTDGSTEYRQHRFEELLPYRFKLDR
jgi:cytidine deaminase